MMNVSFVNPTGDSTIIPCITQFGDIYVKNLNLKPRPNASSAQILLALPQRSHHQMFGEGRREGRKEGRQERGKEERGKGHRNLKWVNNEEGLP